MAVLDLFPLHYCEWIFYKYILLGQEIVGTSHLHFNVLLVLSLSLVVVRTLIVVGLRTVLDQSVRSELLDIKLDLLNYIAMSGRW